MFASEHANAGTHGCRLQPSHANRVVAMGVCCPKPSMLSAVNSADTDESAILAAVSHPDMNTCTVDGFPLLLAAIRRTTAAQYGLMASNPRVDVSVTCAKGRTALHVCAILNDVEKMSILLRRNDININAKTNDGNTALSLSAFLGHAEAVRLLLRSPHVDVDTRNAAGVSALYSATYRKHQDCASVLLSRSMSIADILYVATSQMGLTHEARRAAGRIARWYGQELGEEVGARPDEQCGKDIEEEISERPGSNAQRLACVSRKSVVAALTIVSRKGFGRAAARV